MVKFLKKVFYSIAYRIKLRPSAIERIPIHLKNNFRALDAKSLLKVKESLKKNYFNRQIWEEYCLTTDEWLLTEEGRKDLSNHLDGRLEGFRKYIIPWLENAKPLSGAKILEIGCGTGASSVALAEQGADVTAMDVDEESIIVARDRCKAFGLNVNFCISNATEIQNLFSGKHFDFIIFFASLEHMTFFERLETLKKSWTLLPKNGLLCVVETPNRLWYYDNHTSKLPFFMWLPDDVAFHYSRFSERKPFCDSYRNFNDDAMESFLRHGRGVSYHEFELAIDNFKGVEVVSYLSQFLKDSASFKLIDLINEFQIDKKYEKFLRKINPEISKGFLQRDLDLIIRKNV